MTSFIEKNLSSQSERVLLNTYALRVLHELHTYMQYKKKEEEHKHR